MTIKKSPGEKLFDVFNIILMVLILIVTIYPFYYLIIASFSDGYALIRGKVIFSVVDFNLAGYTGIPSISNFFNSYYNTLYYTFFGTITSLVVMSMGSYALSRKQLKFRRFFSFAISFTLWFKAGIIPMYLNYSNLGLMDTRFGIIIGFAVNVFYIVIMRSYFEGIPIELEEAARVDGLTNWGTFLRIFLPLSKPMFATITLYCAINRWNGYFWTMILIKDPLKMPLQVILKALIIDNASSASIGVGNANYSSETMVYSVMVVAIIPMLIIYPFVQQFFEKGLTVGAVKG
ncbi:MAG: carbohydrate ABC transporter permease [Clostridia bacterium]